MRRHLDQALNYAKLPIVANSFWLFFDKLIRLALGLFVTAMMARYLGPVEFGALSYAMAFVSLFGVLVTFGADGIIVRDLVSFPGKSNEIITSGFVLRILGSLAALTLILVALALSEPSQSNIYILIISLGLLFQTLDVGELWFQSKTRSKYTVIARMTSFLAFSAIKIILIYLEYPLIYFVYATAAETAVGSILLLAIFLGKSEISKLNLNFFHVRSMAKESFPYVISAAAVMLYMRIDQVMLNKMAGNYETGLYSAALKFSEIWYLVPTIIVSTMLPKITKIFQESENSYFETLQTITIGLCRLAIAISIMVSLTADKIIEIFFGQKYLAAADILVIHIWSSIFVFIGIAAGPWILHKKLAFYMLFATVLGAMINIILNFAFIPIYGAKGCAIATLISYATSSWLVNSIFGFSRNVFMMQTRAIFGGFFKRS